MIAGRGHEIGLLDQSFRLRFDGRNDFWKRDPAFILRRLGISPEIADGLEMNAAHGRRMFDSELDDCSDLAVVNIRGDRRDKGDADPVFSADTDRFQLFRKQ
jgi:hypothetical protein